MIFETVKEEGIDTAIETLGRATTARNAKETTIETIEGATVTETETVASTGASGAQAEIGPTGTTMTVGEEGEEGQTKCTILQIYPLAFLLQAYPLIPQKMTWQTCLA